MDERARGASCPACGGPFRCGVETGTCWCRDVEVSQEKQRQLAADFRGCLCPACLATLGSSAGYPDGRRPGTSRLGASGVSPGA